MTERERLIELLIKGQPPFNPLNDVCIEKLADYLLENGVIVPPCKVGTRVYEIVEMPKHTFISEFPIVVEPYQIIYKNIMGATSCIPFDAIGKTVFLTKEEAEQALRKEDEGK